MKVNLKKILCKKFCSYYKPSKKEDLACMGFLVVERLLKSGKVPLSKTDNELKPHTKETLLKNMCIVCPFYEDGCDFVIQPEKCPPCGGFIVAGHLLETNIITIDNIKDVG